MPDPQSVDEWEWRPTHKYGCDGALFLRGHVVARIDVEPSPITDAMETGLGEQLAFLLNEAARRQPEEPQEPAPAPPVRRMVGSHPCTGCGQLQPGCEHDEDEVCSFEVRCTPVSEGTSA